MSWIATEAYIERVFSWLPGIATTISGLIWTLIGSYLVKDGGASIKIAQDSASFPTMPLGIIILGVLSIVCGVYNLLTRRSENV